MKKVPDGFSMTRDPKGWSLYALRLPKSQYDFAYGWNTSEPLGRGLTFNQTLVLVRDFVEAGTEVEFR